MRSREHRGAPSVGESPREARAQETAEKSRLYGRDVIEADASRNGGLGPAVPAKRPGCVPPARPCRVICDLPTTVGFTGPAALAVRP